MRVHTLLILAAALAASPALAQNQRGTTRAERTVEGLNNSMNYRSESRDIQQQNRFETNQLQGQIRREQTLPLPPVTPGIIAPAR
ncbi:hypothetical protein M446_1085 [Methylobacterium sp. 4-46]|uniref:hypothetical protein n=1 Tax=unclassified Methylobacterium TaxID=2615210 RepID=UPI000152D2DC|nr:MULTISPECIES: hypothetical protein [Methylobacterium]ACA15613.1 hypothetical protein M446_1085 [Methylobacterium sp. 4-46]WFT81327.1 hypothetical protein QA634_05385 [Methylobacterium nodulans]